jgi:predicted RNA-binding Zn-ribbon protein involved in translation (DUF1610 family)
MGKLVTENCSKCGRPLRMGEYQIVFCPACEPGQAERSLWCSDCREPVSVVSEGGSQAAYCLAGGHFVGLADLVLLPYGELRPSVKSRITRRPF